MNIEISQKTGGILSHIFYCDPHASWQKGAIEKNHEYIRYVLPKKTSFDNLTQEDMYTLASNINSTNRDILNGKSPYEAVQLLLDEELINKLQIYRIDGDDVNLSPKLLKRGSN